MTRRTVSVVINNYNYARFLRQAIDSALAQTHPAEVIVVDDGSTDGSVEVIQSYGDQIRSVLKSNGGQGSAFNAGFAAVSGDLILLLDSDDYLGANAVERLVAACDDETDILYHRLLVVDSTGRVFDVNPPARDLLQAGDMVPELLQHGRYCFPPTSGQVYSRRIFEKILPVPEAEWTLCADTYLALAAPFYGRVTTMEESVAFYRVHDANRWGLPQTRETFTRAKLQTNVRFGLARQGLIQQLAGERGLPPPPDLAASYHFSELLLYRSAPSGYEVKKGVVLYAKLLRHLWKERSGTWRLALQKTVAGLLLVIAPRVLLRKIYPRLFDQP